VARAESRLACEAIDALPASAAKQSLLELAAFSVTREH